MFLYYETSIYQDLGRFDEAVRTAERALLLAPINWDAEYTRITSLLASGERQLAQSAVSRLKSRTASGFNPLSAYGDAIFPQSVTNAITLTSNASLQGLSYNEGLRLVLEDLGWNTD
jgi:tetratricopeptide (TPR) repeat protein